MRLQSRVDRIRRRLGGDTSRPVTAVLVEASAERPAGGASA